MNDDYALDETEQDAAAEIAVSTIDYLSLGEEAVKKTYGNIEAELKWLREQKDAIQERINELVEAERLWFPLVRRLERGIVPRSGGDEDA